MLAVNESFGTNVGKSSVKHYFLLHLNLADSPVAYKITAVSLMVMGNSKNLHILISPFCSI